MSDWTAGYVADVGYIYGYYPELNPLRLRLAFLNAGYAPPEIATACELGFGQGMSVNLHAAASPNQWWSTDFNPSQAVFARELASASGTGVQLFDQSFAEFCGRPDLPGFDYIGLHGIWSWISDENRAVIVDFVRRKLNVGGVLYISYNTHPGWAAMLPMRHLLTEHAKIMAAPGDGTIKRIESALSFADRLIATRPRYTQENPQVAERLKKLKEQDRHYLAHELFNRDWHPMHFADMANWLVPAKLNFTCSAHYLDQLEPIHLTAEQQQFLHDIADPAFRESVRDFLINQQFRRDYWSKGTRKLSTLEQSEAQRKQRVILIEHRPGINMEIKGVLGNAHLQEEIYSPLLDLLADHQPKTLAQLEQQLSSKNLELAQIQQAVSILIGKAVLAPAQDDKTAAKAKSHTDKLNQHLLSMAKSSANVNYLASPVTGGGIPIARFSQLFLLARAQGKKQPDEWATYAWEILDAQRQKIVKNGATLATAEENLAELRAAAKTFNDEQLPILKALAIA